MKFIGKAKLYSALPVYLLCNAEAWRDGEANIRKEIKEQKDQLNLSGGICSNEVLRLFLLLLFKVRFICYTAWS